MSQSRPDAPAFESSALAEAYFYEAFANIDVQGMSEVWLSSDAAYCIHPNGRPLLGFQAVQESWRAMFSGGQPVTLFYRVVTKQVNDGMAIHLVEEELSAADGSRRGLITATNCYLKTERGWRLFSHHGSPMIVPEQSQAETSARIH
ncbi:MAG: nuclear transport factor 2 family protein [Candidatus Thiodiazotropha sp. (ex Monitilora ramsayi)]|nr:nuclear transport factor 2 family protein [Candidatus Thiodiazotropha sp. (ex Monitilora ramsayi)]